MRSLAEEAMMREALRDLQGLANARAQRYQKMLDRGSTQIEVAAQELADDIDDQILAGIYRSLGEYEPPPRFVFDTLAIPWPRRDRVWVRLASLNTEA